jgi:hypothetical protein
MAREEQDTSWGLLFPLSLQSADRCLGTLSAPINPGGKRFGTGLGNVIPIIQPASSQIKDITPFSLIGQPLSLPGWKSAVGLGAAAPSSGNHTIGVPEDDQRFRGPRGNIKGRSRRSR